MQAEVIFRAKKKVNKIYLNDFIENNSSLIKKIFLSIIENTGKKKILKKNLRTYFQVNDYVNLWDLSQFSEKNIFRKDYINKCLQYLAILEIIKYYRVKEIRLNNIDNEIYKILIKYKKNVNFKVLKKSKKSFIEVSKIFILGNWLTAILIFFTKNISLKSNLNEFNYDSKNLILSYFCHYKKNFENKKFFVSDHWRGLEKKIKKDYFYLNFFISTQSYKSYNSLKTKVDEKIQNIKKKNFINNYFYFNDLIKVFYISFIYSWKFFFLFLILKNKKDPQFALLELSYNVQKISFSGLTCLENLKIYYSIKKFFHFNPNIKKCIYLMENHSWEKILLNFCYKRKILSYGYVHATIPFWHLNYYQSKKFNKKNIYLPKKILTTSKINLNLLINQGINKKKLELVEALRYNWLNKFKNKKTNYSTNKILVFGDYEKKINKELLEIIKNLLEKRNDLVVYYKPHPGDINNYDYKINRLKIIYHLPKKLNFKLYVFSNSTSAAAEYTHLTNDIAIFNPKFSINLSPFKGLKKYQSNFFSNEIELKKILTSKVKNKFNFFFYLNDTLTKWKNII
tara:strand:+ start:3751 stop:5454 length:1704 start_codon:yes stop_codon:yes gene_type:complete